MNGKINFLEEEEETLHEWLMNSEREIMGRDKKRLERVCMMRPGDTKTKKERKGKFVVAP